MKTYLKMNTQIVDILRRSDNPAVLYAAARIEELEAERDALMKACEKAISYLGAEADHIKPGEYKEVTTALLTAIKPMKGE